jgi:flagellar protein FlaG
MMEAINNQFKVPSFEGGAARATISVEGVAAAREVESVNIIDKGTGAGSSAVFQERTDEKPASSNPVDALEEAVTQINSYVQNLQRNLQFTVDEETGKDIVTVTDSVSNEVIRQIPSEEALALARRLAENEETSVYLISERA